MSTVPRPMMRYHGGKWMLAPWIIEQMPPHDVYVEAFGGAASILMRKPRVKHEVLNDMSGDIVNIYRVLRDPASAEELDRRLRLTPYARDEFSAAYDPSDDPIDKARHALVRAQMGFGTAGATRTARTGFRGQRIHQAVSPASEWRTRVRDGVAAFTERLLGVTIENRSALDVLRQCDSARALHYLDPPYVIGSRSAGAKGNYAHEMTDAEQEALLAVALDLKGSVMISGYDHDIYRDMLGSWERRDVEANASGRAGGVARTESLWLNERAAANQRQTSLPLAI